MKEIEGVTQISDKLLAVPVPQDAKFFEILEQDSGNVIEYHANCRWHTETIPEGNYELLGLCTPEFEIEYHALLLSKGLDINGNYLIISKI